MWLSTVCTLSIERMWRKKALTITFDKKEEIKSVLEPNEPTSGRLSWLPWHEVTRSITTPPWMGYQSIARLLLGDWTLVKYYGMYVGTMRKNIKRCWVELMCGRLFPAITVTPPPPSISSGFPENSPVPSYTPLTSDLMLHVYFPLKLLSIPLTKVWEKLLWHCMVVT